jgi:hypothetical protein
MYVRKKKHLEIAKWSLSSELVQWKFKHEIQLPCKDLQLIEIDSIETFVHFVSK